MLNLSNLTNLPDHLNIPNVKNSNSSLGPKLPLFRDLRHRASTIELHLRSSNDVEENPGPVINHTPGSQLSQRGPVVAVTYNVRGLGEERKLRHLLNFLQQRKMGKNLDFISCLQETYIESAGKIPYIWRGNYFLTPGNGHSCGCLTLLSSHISVLASQSIENRGHILACQKSGDQGVTYIVANVYAPNPNSNEKIEFFNNVFETIAEFQERYGCEKILVLGDFNLNFKATEMRNRNYSSQEQRVAAVVKDRKENLELSDIWDDNEGFTWRRPNTDIFSTIDRIMFSKRTLETTVTEVNWSLSYSDHAAVESNFRYVNSKIRSRSKITRLDPSLAKETWSKVEIEQKFNEMFATAGGSWDPHMKLEFAKVCIRTVVEQVQADRKKNEKSEEDTLNEELETSILKLSTGTLSGNRKTNLLDYVEDLRNKKSELIETKGKRLAERLGTKWYNEGEKSTRYFLRLLNRAVPDDFKSVSSASGEVTDPDQIEREIVHFYKHLYETYDKSQLITMEEEDDFFKELDQVSANEANSLIEPISLSELTATLQSCRDSAPGPDGSPYSILGLLWSTYGKLLADAWNYSISTGKLPPSHKSSYLKLIPKVGKDLKELTNWRPITLSNCDHKLITKTYANRMSKSVAPIIRERQTAYLKGRLINDNIRSMLGTINITNLEERCKGLLVSLDAKKAFDSVEHSYIERCLKELGLQSFNSIFRLLYSELSTDIIINGRIVKGYNILRGVKQGDSLSCILFIICMEPLLRNIENNHTVEPISSEALGDLPKVYAYADDVNGTLKDSAVGLQSVFNEYERLTRRSGLQLNADKTEVMRLGTADQMSYHILYMNTQYVIETKNKIKINGVVLQREESALADENVQLALAKMDKFFRVWSRRNLSTLGRILIVKTFGISQLIFLMQSIELKSNHYKTVNALIYKYIWNRHYLAAKAPERIKRDILNKSIKLGGYGMLDVTALDESLKLRAIGRLLTSHHPFLTLLRNKCSFEDFFDPMCPPGIESVTSKGIKLLKLERDKVWEIERAYSSASLLQKVKATSISKVLSTQGRLSIPYFLLRRRGVTKLGELSQRDLREIERYIEPRKLGLITRSRLPLTINLIDIKGAIFVKNKFKDLGKCSSKEIRESRSPLDPITSYKLGTNLTGTEALSWGYKLSKLTSIKHRNILLRVAHGEFYTKARLQRFNLIDDNSCPRCGETETLAHKFIECEYVKRIWQKVYSLSNQLLGLNQLHIENFKGITGAFNESTLTSLTINAEILLRLSYLKDDQTYLIHPKTFVANCLKCILLNEGRREIKEEVKTLLEP